MNGDFENLINELKKYEEEIINIKSQFNPEDTGLKMEFLTLKMNVVFYNYIIACFETLNELTKDKYLYISRKALTALSYGLTILSLFKARDITLPSLLGSFLLSVKNQKHDRVNYSISDEQINELLDLIDSFENDYANEIDRMYEKIDLYEDDEIINKLPDSEKKKRFVCKKLMQFLRGETDQLLFQYDNIDYNTFTKELIVLLDDFLNTDNKDLYSLIEDVEEKYEVLSKKLTKLDKKDERLSKIYRIFG